MKIWQKGVFIDSKYGLYALSKYIIDSPLVERTPSLFILLMYTNLLFGTVENENEKTTCFIQDNHMSSIQICV